MELAFAINILIAGWWDNIYAKLFSLIKLDGEVHDFAMVGVAVDASEIDALKQERVDIGKSMRVVVRCIKALCFVFGMLIVAALLTISGESKFNFWYMPWFLVVPGLISCGVMGFGYRKRKKIDNKVVKIIMDAAKEAGRAQGLRDKQK